MVLRCGGWGDCGVRSLELSLVDSSKVHVLLPPNLLYLLLRQIIGKGIIILINGVCLVILTWPGFCASPVHFRQTLAIVAEPCDGMRPGSGAQGSGLSSGSPVPATGLGIERGLPPPPCTAAATACWIRASSELYSSIPCCALGGLCFILSDCVGRCRGAAVPVLFLHPT